MQPLNLPHRRGHLIVHPTVLSKQNPSRHDDFMEPCTVPKNRGIYMETDPAAGGVL